MGLGLLAALGLGLAYFVWSRRSAASDEASERASTKALSSTPGASERAAKAEAAAGEPSEDRFEVANPYLKGARERALLQHGAGMRLGRTAWGAGGAAELVHHTEVDCSGVAARQQPSV